MTSSNTTSEPKVGKYETIFLLAAYRSGYFSLNKKYPSYVPSLLSKLKQRGLLKMTITSTEQSLLFLTDSGADYVRTHFRQILIESFLYQIYPVIVIGDKITVTENLENRELLTFVKAPHTVLPKGEYTVKASDRFCLLLVNDKDVAFRVRMWECKNFLKLELGDLTDIEAVMKLRFADIHLKHLMKSMKKWEPDNLLALQLVQDLRELKCAKGRVQ